MAVPYELFTKPKQRKEDDLGLIAHAAPLGGAPSNSTHTSNSIMHNFSVQVTQPKRVGMGRLLQRRCLRGKHQLWQSKKGLERFGLPRGGWMLYWNDIFHTLLNMPRHRFLLVFFAVYLTEYFVFALLYLTMPRSCYDLTQTHGPVTLGHAMWFSVYTATTLGYSESGLRPNVNCPRVNMLITFQVIVSALIDYCLMGLVFARFAAPAKRSETIRFSLNAVLFRQESGYWAVSFRIANIRKTCLLHPEIVLLLARPERLNSTALKFNELRIEEYTTQLTNLKLGLPATVLHVITPESPLYELSLQEMEHQDLELLCFMDGVDPMTSNSIQARHTYGSQDVRMNEKFTTIDVKARGDKLGLDFSGFDNTVMAEIAATHDDVEHGFLYPVVDHSNHGSSSAAPSSLELMKRHMDDLRGKTIKSLTHVTPQSLVHPDPNISLAQLCEAVLADGSCSSQLRFRAAAIRDHLPQLSNYHQPARS